MLQTQSLPVVLTDGTACSLTVEMGDDAIFPARYSEGRLPVMDDEIALESFGADGFRERVKEMALCFFRKDEDGEF